MTPRRCDAATLSERNAQLTDKATIDALTRSSAGGNVSYVGVFLRKDSHHSHHGPYEPAVVTPEVLTDPDQLYPVGSFAQVHRIQRGADPRPDRPADQLPPGLRPDTDTDAEDDVADNVAEGQASVLLLGHRRVTLTSVDRLGPPVDVTVEHWDRIVTDPFQSDMVRALSNEIVSMIREVATLNPLFREHIHYFPTRVDSNDPMKLADFAASMTTGSAGELQGVLAEKDPEARLHKALTLLTKEREVSRLQQEISAQVEAKMTEAQRRYFLTEQLKSIKKELGMEKDDKDALLGKYRQKLAAFTEIPEEARRAIEAELEKLSALEKNSAEFNVTRTYLDWLTELPWDTATPERYDLARAREILDRQHYGLDDVKDVILQFVAVGKLRGSIQGKILCLAGPPGVGKTSIAKGVAEALGRKFYRFSVGGLSDVSEIRGHRRTYVGAMPGKLIQCLKTTGSNNPLILIDEIDKLGKGFQGDPASALLELLDPSQNSSFRDTYLDVPVDMSKVLFMCTANVLETIPGPLLDRMEIINLSGYDVPEKLEIAERYLVPKSMLESGLLEEKKTDAAEGDTDAPSDADADADPDPDADPDAIPPLPEYLTPSAVPADLAIERSSLESLVRWYCREAGVRNLEKHIRKICRKLALQVVAAAESAPLTERTRRKAPGWTVDADTLDEYVGKPPFTSDRMFPGDTPHGVAMGLAWTSMGGAALYIETQGIVRSADAEGKPRGGGGLRVTGSMKDVMKESTSIAHTVGRKFLHEYQMGNSYFDDYDVHMHVPDGATPKDGPSAGITMVTAMLSLAMDRPVRADLAMTGEVSLSGLVLPVGGIKEKTMAARRAGIDCLVFPAQNKRDYDELPDYLKEGLEVHFAEEYKRVFEIAFMEDDFFDHKI
uniref:Lon protease homolog n=1 Tax=Corethron hystrix TaxID=216773 RepID=A0A7S1BLT3_9STRA|mmetsp:Transcript_31669/g.72627  ORF Transcript_31669/g.72627 Transcript_31669/m.72627 type:complete len:892 (+) Transcript_31669:814-3489(+)